MASAITGTIPFFKEEQSSGRGTCNIACRKFSTQVPLWLTRPPRLILQGNVTTGESGLKNIPKQPGT